MIDFREQLRDYAQAQQWEPPCASIIYDEPNLRRSAKAMLGIRIDLKKVQDFITQKYWMNSKPPVVITDADDNREETYFRLLEHQGFRVVPIPGQNNNGMRKSRTDAVISGEIVCAGLSDSDTIILVSGDGDFEPVFRPVREICHKKIVIYSIHGTLAHSLFSMADEVHFIGKDCAMYKPNVLS